MSAQKPVIQKDWYKPGVDGRSRRTRTLHTFEQVKVTKSEQLPELLTIQEAARKIFHTSPKTVYDWIAKGELRSIKLVGRRFLTPELIADFITTQAAKNG